jgi:hypothetical protein
MDELITRTCPPNGHSWPGPASTDRTPCLCGEKTMSVTYVDHATPTEAPHLPSDLRPT